MLSTVDRERLIQARSEKEIIGKSANAYRVDINGKGCTVITMDGESPSDISSILTKKFCCDVSVKS